MTTFNLNNTTKKYFALGAVVLGLGAGLYVYSSGIDNNNSTAVTETATTEVPATNTATTSAPVEPVNNDVNGTTTTVEGINAPAVTNDVTE